ncbi:hypothetical protein Tco_1516374 [Tanacetum coccineum]
MDLKKNDDDDVQTYKQLYDSIKPTRIRSKEQCDALVNQVNQKSVEISDLNVSLQEKDLVITALKDELRKLKGKDLADNVVTKHTIAPEMLKIDVEPIAPRLLNNRTAHSDYLRHTQEQAAILREIVEQGKSQNPLNNSLDSALVVTPKNKDKRVRFTEPVTSSGNTNIKTASSSNLVSNKPMLSSTGVKPSTSASGSQPSGNTKKDKIQQTPSSTQKNKHSKLNANSKLLCVKCNGCMLSDNHDLCVLDFINDVNAHVKSKSVKKSSKRKVWKPTGKVFTNIGYTWRPTGQTFTIVGNACPLTRITTTAEVPLRKPTALETDTPKPVVTLVYSRKPRKSKTNVPVSKPKIIKSISANKKEPSKSWGSIVSDVPSSSLDESRHGLVRGLLKLKFEKDHLYSACAMGKKQEKTHKPKSDVHQPRKTLSLAHGSLWTNACRKYFDELTAMASKHSSLEPALHEMTHATISSGLMPNPPPSTSCVLPSRTDWDILFQPLFDELLNLLSSVDLPAPGFITSITEVVAPKPAASTGSSSSTTVDQDAPSPSNSQTTPETQSHVISNDVEEENHDLDVAHMNNDPFFGILILENNSEASSLDVNPHIVQTADPIIRIHITNWTKGSFL